VQGEVDWVVTTALVAVTGSPSHLKAARAKMTRLMEVTKKWAADSGVTFSTDESEGKGKDTLPSTRSGL
jgi:hypothetical protein